MDNRKLNRREFLKILTLLPFASGGSPHKITPRSLFFPAAQTEQRNILIFLFDTLSARNISLYGYPRETMPNLTRFAEKSTVYHQHHASGNWTPTGTASLLTGTYPWKNRCISMYSETLDSFGDKNIFSITNRDYNTLAYTQNFFAETLLQQFKSHINDHIDMRAGGLYSFRTEGDLFENDFSNSFWGQNIVQGTWKLPASSPFLSVLNEVWFTVKNRLLRKDLNRVYPNRLAMVIPGVYVFLDETIAWLQQQIPDTPMPTLSYYHFFPPHSPYSPRVDFNNLFDDDWVPPDKPLHAFADGSNRELLLRARRRYDQYIANIDHDFGTVLDLLEELGMMENSYIIFTSDHGESFERGAGGHHCELLYEPLTHIPLLIHKPSQTTREDIYTPTSAVDVLPTICEITGQDIPEWVEGEVLPGFHRHLINPQRPIFSLEAKENNKFGPLTIATVAMIKWPHKLIHYFGYEELPYNFELYNLEEDPEELDDLYPSNSNIVSEMENELLDKLEQVNQNLGMDS
jgi:arylsulfatase A-like enzyme